MPGASLFVFLLAGWHLASAQGLPTAPAGETAKCVLEGTVTDAQTGELLRKVSIRVTPQSAERFGSSLAGNRAGYLATSDASGRFHLEGVRAGDYSVEGERGGYAETALGATQPGGQGIVLHLQAGAKLANLELRLFRHSVISGKVVDENGEPIVGATVQIVHQQWFRGRRAYFANSQASTNEAGEYRMEGLMPGRSYLYASGSGDAFVEEQGNPEKRTLSLFYAGAQTLADATVLDVHAGEEMTRIDFRLPSAAVFHVRGTVDARAIADRPERDLMIVLRERGLPPEIADNEGELKRDGNFDIAAVASGEYEINLVKRNGGQELAAMPVEVRGKDVNGLAVLAAKGLDVRGTVRVPGSQEDSVLGTAVSLSRVGADLGRGAYRTNVSSDGRFTIENVSPGKYVVDVYAPKEGKYVKSILYAEHEVAGSEIDFSGGVSGDLAIVLGTALGKVSGAIKTPDGSEADSQKPQSQGSNVVLVSDPLRLDAEEVRSAAIDQERRFVFKNVPPGKYNAFAAMNVELGLWENAEFLAQVEAKGVPVTVAENGNVQIQLPILGAEDVQRALGSLAY